MSIETRLCNHCRAPRVPILGTTHHAVVLVACDAEEALDLAGHYPYPDTFGRELGKIACAALEEEESNDD